MSPKETNIRAISKLALDAQTEHEVFYRLTGNSRYRKNHYYGKHGKKAS